MGQDKRTLIGFFGRVARIARVHQEGLKDRVSKKGPEYQYPARPLLGFSATDQALIRDSLLRHLKL
ncbi:phage virion morphogenesis protein [Collimonas silvisoli]|uniref:phage virion morphogenesis protein n=1 Tax=Collimonas silvisoli TaxID=2825884 RepID=UPI002E7A1B94|nr:phage virion morphogenesis protein [Collimonas silvisoli]